MSINGYVVLLSSLVIAVTLITLFLPNGRTKKTLNTVISGVIILSLFKPITYLKGQSFSKDDFSFLYAQETFRNYANEKFVSLNESACLTILSELGINDAIVTISTSDSEDFFSIKFAEIDLRDAVIIPKKENIDIKEEVKKAISEFLRIDKEAVFLVE